MITLVQDIRQDIGVVESGNMIKLKDILTEGKVGSIYNMKKQMEDGTFAREVYNAGWGYNHSGNSGLVGYWKFNEGSGTTVKDYGPYEKHGTLTSDANQGGSGTPTWEKNGSYE